VRRESRQSRRSPDAPKADAMLARPAFSQIIPCLVVSAALSATASFAQSPRGPAPTTGRTPSKSTDSNGRTNKSLKVAQNRSAAPPITGEDDEPAPREPSRKVMRIASLSPEEIKAKQSTALRRSVTVYVPKLVTERQNVARTIVAPVTSNELRPVWSPGQNRWLTYQPTSHTMWSQRVEVVPMDVPVWKYVAETRYLDEPVVRQNFYAPTQMSPEAAAWAWKQPGPYAAPLIPSVPPRGQRPVISFLQSRPILGRFFGGGRPVFAPSPAPVGPVAANYQPVNYYQPNFMGATYAPSIISGTGVPGFVAPPLPTSGVSGAFGGVRTYQ
jgi:hypothetical protein